MHAAAEDPARVAAILEAGIGEPEPPVDQGLGPILRVHDSGYVEFLQAAHSDWLAAGRSGDAFPYTFPLVGPEAGIGTGSMRPSGTGSTHRRLAGTWEDATGAPDGVPPLMRY
jgi:acetoin utilization deacetylase AcuC-like enzyme